MGRWIYLTIFVINIYKWTEYISKLPRPKILERSKQPSRHPNVPMHSHSAVPYRSKFPNSPALMFDGILAWSPGPKIPLPSMSSTSSNASITSFSLRHHLEKDWGNAANTEFISAFSAVLASWMARPRNLFLAFCTLNPTARPSGFLLAAVFDSVTLKSAEKAVFASLAFYEVLSAS